MERLRYGYLATSVLAFVVVASASGAPGGNITATSIAGARLGLPPSAYGRSHGSTFRGDVFRLPTGFVTSSTQATVLGKNGQIAFRRYFDRNHTHGAIFVINPDGSGLREVTRTPERVVDDQPDWSSDGELLVFASNRDKVGRSTKAIYSAIYTVRADGSELTRLSPECTSPAPDPTGCPYDFLPSFSPDGGQVVFTRAPGVVTVMARDGGDDRVLVNATATDSEHSGYTVTDAQLSPDGKRLLFVRDNRGALKPKDGKAIYVATSRGKAPRRVTPWSLGGGDNPDWSPDGRWILFRSNEELVAQPQIYTVHPDGTGLRQLTHFKRGTIVTSSSFSPDGKWIVYGSTGAAGQADIFVMRADGTGSRPVTHTKDWESAPDWGPAR